MPEQIEAARIKKSSCTILEQWFHNVKEIIDEFGILSCDTYITWMKWDILLVPSKLPESLLIKLKIYATQLIQEGRNECQLSSVSV